MEERSKHLGLVKLTTQNERSVRTPDSLGFALSWPLPRMPVILHIPSKQKTGQAETPARFFDSVSLVVGQGFRKKRRAIPSAPRAAPSNITVAPLSGTATPDGGGRGWRSALT